MEELQGQRVINTDDPLAESADGIGGTGESIDSWSLAGPDEATSPGAWAATK